MTTEFNEIVCPACFGELTKKDDFLQCMNCSTRYHYHKKIPLLIDSASSTENYVKHYQKDAEAIDYFRKKSPQVIHDTRRIEEYVISYMSGKNNRILDVGAGRSWVARRFHQHNKVVSLDISPVNIEKALQVVAHKNHTGVVADANKLPFPDNTFDYVISTEVIEHVNDPSLFLKNLFRVLKPHGKLIITTMYKEKIKYSLCIHCNNLTPHNAHIHSFDEHSLENLLQQQPSDFTFRTFGNKVLTRLRSHWLLRHLPFGMWKLLDTSVTAIISKPERIICVFSKK